MGQKKLVFISLRHNKNLVLSMLGSAFCMYSAYANNPAIPVPEVVNCLRPVERADYQKLAFAYPAEGKGTAIYELFEKNGNIKEIITLQNLKCDSYQNVGDVGAYIYCNEAGSVEPLTWMTSSFGFAGMYWPQTGKPDGFYNTIIKLKNPYGPLTGKYQPNSPIFNTFLGECLFK